MNKKMIILSLAVGLLTPPVYSASGHPDPADKPLPVAGHAHNDYQHDHPLWDALHFGFSSVEADLHLVEGEFYVAHDPEDILPDRKIRPLYLDPLRDLVARNNGVYPDGSGIMLLIDLKSEGPEVWPALRELLLGYRPMLTFLRDGKVVPGPVTVVISGNRDWTAMVSDRDCPALYDGRIDDLAAEPDSSLIPLISASWTDEFTWKGQGNLPGADAVKMTGIIDAAHRQGRRVRFWATDLPEGGDQEHVWNLLREAGVDYINTDRLAEFNAYAGKSPHP